MSTVPSYGTPAIVAASVILHVPANASRSGRRAVDANSVFSNASAGVAEGATWFRSDEVGAGEIDAAVF
jgi:hypothetical protein